MTRLILQLSVTLMVLSAGLPMISAAYQATQSLQAALVVVK